MWRANSLEKTLMLGKIEGRKRRWAAEDEMLDGITDSVDMSLSKLLEIMKDTEAWKAHLPWVSAFQELKQLWHTQVYNEICLRWKRRKWTTNLSVFTTGWAVPGLPWAEALESGGWVWNHSDLRSQGTRLTRGVGPYRQEPHTQAGGAWNPLVSETGRDLEEAPFQCLVLFSHFQVQRHELDFQIWAQTKSAVLWPWHFANYLSSLKFSPLTGETERRKFFFKVLMQSKIENIKILVHLVQRLDYFRGSINFSFYFSTPPSSMRTGNRKSAGFSIRIYAFMRGFFWSILRDRD